jgi:hypothetical protein
MWSREALKGLIAQRQGGPHQPATVHEQERSSKVTATLEVSQCMLACC